jgi:chemotaxis family two-component system sensor histidine kinase/response regulator PixL
MAINPEIRDQAYQFFVEEAADLLQTIESGILTLRQERETAHIHSLMRAAHSLKGGAASVGLEVIQAIAHRLETIFKALYCDSLEIDAELESQLLQAFDCLRLPLTEQLTQGHFDAEQALAHADPILVQIEQVLQAAIAETQDYIPSSADLGFNMTTSIFEVDVKQGLDRLVSVLETPEVYEVAGELRAQLEVFTGFSELLALPGFGSIAQTALQALEANPDHALEITEQALVDLWSARTAVLSGDTQQGGSPSEGLLALTQPMQPAPPPVEPPPPVLQPLIAEELAALLEQLDDREDAVQILAELGIVDEMAELLVDQIPLESPPPAPSPPPLLPNLDQLASIFGASQAQQAEEMVALISEAAPAPLDAPQVPLIAETLAKTRPQKRPTGSTVRVDSDRLTRINRLMGELSINRNGLALQNEQMRSAIRELTARFSRFQTNVEQLRQVSDQMLVFSQRQDLRWASPNGHSLIHAGSAHLSTSLLDVPLPSNSPSGRAQPSANPLLQSANSSVPNAAPPPPTHPCTGERTFAPTHPPIHPSTHPPSHSPPSTPWNWTPTPLCTPSLKRSWRIWLSLQRLSKTSTYSTVSQSNCWDNIARCCLRCRMKSSGPEWSPWTAFSIGSPGFSAICLAPIKNPLT